MENCDKLMGAIRSDVPTGEILHMISTKSQFRLLKAKQHNVVVVRAERVAYWLPQILLFFELRVSGAKTWNEY